MNLNKTFMELVPGPGADGQQAISYFDEAAGRDRILVVDDDAQLCQMFLDYFTRRGYEATAALDAAEALAAAQERSADIVILDVMLGDDDGLEVLDQLKKAYPGLPVVVITGLGYDDHTLAKAMEKGADGYMSKGSSPDVVLDQIKRVLSKRNPPRPG